MHKIIVKFKLMLEDFSIDYPRLHGPLFHRWLPDGENDAIVLDTKSSSILKVWFERKGIVEVGWIRYDENRNEIDPYVMSKQGVLDAGSLIGSLEFLDLSDYDLNILKENKINNELYKKIGNKIVKIIGPPLEHFFHILRIRYGQYWIRDFEKWDSIRESVGNYCKSLHMKWSIDGIIWLDFIPDDGKKIIFGKSVIGKDFSNYLTEKDWRDLHNALKNVPYDSLASVTLARTHQYMDQGDLKHAFIEGSTALELAIEEFYHLALQNSPKLNEDFRAFWNLSDSVKLIAIGTALKFESNDIENAIEATRIRHKIVHEGFTPDDTTTIKLNSLKKVVSLLLGGTPFRFPTKDPGNAIMLPSQWDEEHEK